MSYTQEQIDRANQVNLEQFLRSQGEKLINSGHEYRWERYDSLTVNGNKWFRHSQNKGGYPVDFVMEFFDKTFPEAVQMLIGEEAVELGTEPAPKKKFKLPSRSESNVKIMKYLTEERKLLGQFSRLYKVSKIKRTYLVMKYRFYKQSPIQIIGELLFI